MVVLLKCNFTLAHSVPTLCEGGDFECASARVSSRQDTYQHSTIKSQKEIDFIDYTGYVTKYL